MEGSGRTSMGCLLQVSRTEKNVHRVLLEQFRQFSTMLPNATYPLRLENVPRSKRQNTACRHSCLVPGTMYVYEVYTYQVQFYTTIAKINPFFCFVILEFSSTRMTTGMPCDRIRTYVRTYVPVQRSQRRCAA